MCTWLGALGDLDLQLVGVHQELGRHAKPAAGNLQHGLDAFSENIPNRSGTQAMWTIVQDQHCPCCQLSSP
jgi:hypothetical protein